MNRFVNKVFHGDAFTLLREMHTASIDACISDAMYGHKKGFRYDSGPDPGQGDPDKHWQYHQPYYRECLRVLKPGDVLAWGQSFRFLPYFENWFGPHRIWSPLWWAPGLNYFPNVWVVQTNEQRPIEHPNDMVVAVDRKSFVPLKKQHPCPKAVEEMIFLVEALTRPNDLILDCFCGLGSTLVAAQRLGRRWIGCDLSRLYCDRHEPVGRIAGECVMNIAIVGLRCGQEHHVAKACKGLDADKAENQTNCWRQQNRGRNADAA